MINKFFNLINIYPIYSICIFMLIIIIINMIIASTPYYQNYNKCYRKIFIRIYLAVLLLIFKVLFWETIKLNLASNLETLCIIVPFAYNLSIGSLFSYDYICNTGISSNTDHYSQSLDNLFMDNSTQNSVGQGSTSVNTSQQAITQDMPVLVIGDNVVISTLKKDFQDLYYTEIQSGITEVSKLSHLSRIVTSRHCYVANDLVPIYDSETIKNCIGEYRGDIDARVVARIITHYNVDANNKQWTEVAISQLKYNNYKSDPLDPVSHRVLQVQVRLGADHNNNKKIWK